MTLALFAIGKTARIVHGDSAVVLRGIADNSIDAVVTDPPAGIKFMGNAWDSNKGGRDKWIAWLAGILGEALRVLRPGGHALVWSLPKTSHWTGMAIENAGFAMCDRLVHLFGQGMPKGTDVGKLIDEHLGVERPVLSIGSTDGYKRKPRRTQPGGGVGEPEIHQVVTGPGSPEAEEWDGWKIALKPACEDWWLAQKPREGTIAANILKHRTGALNIKGCRIPGTAKEFGRAKKRVGGVLNASAERRAAWAPKPGEGRHPANVMLDEEAARMLDEQSGETGCHSSSDKAPRTRATTGRAFAADQGQLYNDRDGASRFFYIAKAEEGDKTEGGAVDNDHETVKSVALMRWLVRLITPPGGTVLDCFAGSGTTGVACAAEGLSFIGVEQNAEHFETARARLERHYGTVETRLP